MTLFSCEMNPVCVAIVHSRNYVLLRSRERVFDRSIALCAVHAGKQCHGVGVPWDNFPFCSEFAEYEDNDNKCFEDYIDG